MRGSTRRSVLSGVVGLSVTGIGIVASPGLARPLVEIPKRPMRLSRRLERELRGDDVLIVERSWQVEFSIHGSGLAVTGHQLSASVQAPPSLAPLARIEETRSTEDMFPLLLSQSGAIVAVGDSLREEDLSEAIRLAQDVIARHADSASEKRGLLLYLAQVQKAGASLLETLPSDLFFPNSKPVRRTEEVSLPDGLTGEFEFSYHARKTPSFDWLDSAERRVVTRIGPNSLQSSEIWTLSEI